MTPGVEARKRPLPAESVGIASSPVRRGRAGKSAQTQPDAFLSVLTSAACSLSSPGAPVIACESRNAILHLEQLLKPDADLVARFLECFQSFIADENNLRRILLPMSTAGKNGSLRACDSLARALLSVTPIQSAIASSLLEKLPEYIGQDENMIAGPLPPLMESIPRLILSQFRWLEYLVDSRNLTEKLLEILTICPLGLKKEIISFLPEVIADAEHELVVQSLEQMLQDDLQLIVPVLDAFSSFNLDERLFEQVVALALSSLRSADAEDLPLVVKFLLQSATASNVKQVVQQLRENLQFVSIADVRMSKPDRKQKGKSKYTNCEALVLEAIRSGLRFQNLVLEAFLKEIRSVEGEKNHRVVDIWLLLIIHVNGGPYRKTAQHQIFQKIARGDIGQSLLRQCIQFRGDSLQEYFHTLIAVSESCLRSRQLVARQFGIHAHELLFEEFTEPYYRQEVLGSLITLTGSGISHEVGSALDTLLLLATKHAVDLLPISSFINGILECLEGFEDNHLRQVYKIFSLLAVSAWLNEGGCSNVSSAASELLIIVRKQISSPDPKYKKMGIIGAVGLASCLARESSTETETEDDNHQRSSTNEAISLLQMILEACKSSALSRGFFYDELTAQAETTSLNGQIINWISKHTNEFETLFLGDLDNGQLQAGSPHSQILEGEIWMNLDGEVSPIILNLLPMLTAYDRSLPQALLFLTANFRLLSAVERVINQGSLGSIDALLGCPMYLPKHQLLIGDTWERLPKQQKELVCLALFHAINWTRELINAFSTQIEGRLEDLMTQTTREEIVAKLRKRARNLMFLEFCLAECLASLKLPLPQLHSVIDQSNQSKAEPRSGNGWQGPRKISTKQGRKNGSKKGNNTKDLHGTQKGGDNTQREIPSNGGSRQQTIRDAFNKAQGKNPGVEPGDPSQIGCLEAEMSREKDIRGESLDEQRWKFRPLSLSSMILLAVQVPQDSCCPDSVAMLPVYLYLLQDLQLKLDSCLEAPHRKVAPWMQVPALPKAPSGLGGVSGLVVVKKLATIFPSLRKHLDCSIALLQSADSAALEEQKQDSECSMHWQKESVAACNPPDERFDVTLKEAAESVFLVTIRCLEKVFAFSELILPANFPLLKEILLSFGTTEPRAPNSAISPAPGSMEQAFCQAYAYLDGLSEQAMATSFTTATELVMMLKTLVSCAQVFTENSMDDPRWRKSNVPRTSEILPYLRSHLSYSAGKVLRHAWEPDEWKRSKGDMMQQLLRMQIGNSELPIEHLEELACTVMPQVPSKGNKTKVGLDGYPALSPATFAIWYRVTHEEVLGILSKMMKGIQAHGKYRTALAKDLVAKVLVEAQQCITVHVSLVNLTKTHDKAPVHAMAVKSGGKFVDTFLKGMDFFKLHYEDHKETIISMVKDLQRATRIIQTLCSDAKGQKRMPVTCRVPLVKRSMERYLFCVKALLHGTSHGDSFWMGNLKHKDLHGHEISSQLYAHDVEEEAEDDQDEQELEDGLNNISDAEDAETAD